MNTSFSSKTLLRAFALMGVMHIGNLHADGKNRMAALQQEFLQMQKNVGITTPANKFFAQYPVRGKQASQEQFDSVRRELHRLLTQSPLDGEAIKELILKFAKMNPGRWPQPADYLELLNVKLALAQSADEKVRKENNAQALKKQQPPLPALPQQPPLPRLPQQPPLPALPVRERAESEPEVIRAEGESEVKMTAAVKANHDQIQEEFKQLRKMVGLATAPAEMKQILKVRGKHGSQAQFDEVRSQLNKLLSKMTLTDSDVKNIKLLIQKLANLNPARWPQANDYLEILKLRI